MKKKLFFAAIALTTLAGCTDESYVGDQSLLTNEGGAISFNMSTPAITRSSSTDVEKLNSNFVVYAYKTPTSGDPQVVFDNYQVKWVTNTAGTTESNSADWEYVSYKNLPYGTTTTSGGVLNNDGVAKNAADGTGNIEQSIKYWDFATGTTYDFFAYSLGAGIDHDNNASTPNQYAKASALNKTGYGTGSTNPGYTLEGTAAQLGTCYISKKNHIATPAANAAQVQLNFVSFLSKIQLKFFETIPGYSVKDLVFYYDADNKTQGDAAGDGKKPALYGASGCIPTGGTYTITFDTENAPVVTLTGAASSSDSKVLFDPVTAATTEPTAPAVWLSNYAEKDYEEATGKYIGRTASAATSTSQMTVLPNSSGATLTLKTDYTLVSRDKTGESIEVKGAIATVPADFTKWKPNYAYTYIFKITDNKLVPITLDAVVADAQDGSQETITTVTNPSITTYAKTALADNEYKAGNIYVAVGDGTTALTVGTNANLYTATIEADAAQGITEETVANALTKTADGSGNFVVTDANGKKLTVTPVATTDEDKLVGGLNAIPAADAPGGIELAIKCASFAAKANTTYVFEYIYDTNKKAYKVIKVGTDS